MLTHSNIDRRDSVVVSKAPFTYESTLTINGSVLPAGSFIAVSMYVQETDRVPFRLHSIHTDGKVWFCDATGKLTCYWQTYEETAEIDSADRPYVSSLLYNSNGVVSGLISCTHTVISLIRQVIEGNIENVYLPADAFVLIPQCHVATIAGAGRSFGISSQDDETVYTTSNINIVGATTSYQDEDVADDDQKGFIIVNGTDQVSLTVNICNQPEKIVKLAPVNRICYVVVSGNTHNVIEKSIIIKSDTLSNLRVVKANGTLRFIGVLNA